MKGPTINDFSALIGIDWADKKHNICAVDRSTGEQQYSVISSQPKTIHVWAMSLLERYPNKPVAVGCELTKGPVERCTAIKFV